MNGEHRPGVPIIDEQACVVLGAPCSSARHFRRNGGARLATTSLGRADQQALPLLSLSRATEAAAVNGIKELDRLAPAEMLKRRCVGRRGNSKFPVLAALFVYSPVVTVPLTAKRVGVSQQAATTMIDTLAPPLREITGRERYRAWAACNHRAHRFRIRSRGPPMPHPWRRRCAPYRSTIS